jgi:DNA-binding transcriptional MerR regulator
VESTYGIGETSRRTGLSISALRFYDRQGVLVPAHVDPCSGYRRYTADQVVTGRLVARLRRVGLPLADVNQVLARRHDPAVVRRVLDEHLRRLEHGLALARRELSTVLTDLDLGEQPMANTFTLPAADLGAALRGVRFAVADDPAVPALAGVLLDLRATTLRVVATDRYRLAVSTADVNRCGTAGTDPDADVTALVPVAFVDDVLAACDRAGSAPVTLAVGPDVSVTVGGSELATAVLDEPFPQWELLVDLPTTHRVALQVRTLRHDALAAATAVRRRNGADYPLCAFRVSGDGLVWLAPDDVDDAIGVNRDFLLEALDALEGRQLVLGLHGPYTPLALTSPDRPGALSILMPVRLD